MWTPVFHARNTPAAGLEQRPNPGHEPKPPQYPAPELWGALDVSDTMPQQLARFISEKIQHHVDDHVVGQSIYLNVPLIPPIASTSNLERFRGLLEALLSKKTSWTLQELKTGMDRFLHSTQWGNRLQVDRRAWANINSSNLKKLLASLRKKSRCCTTMRRTPEVLQGLFELAKDKPPTVPGSRDVDLTESNLEPPTVPGSRDVGGWPPTVPGSRDVGGCSSCERADSNAGLPPISRSTKRPRDPQTSKPKMPSPEVRPTGPPAAKIFSLVKAKDKSYVCMKVDGKVRLLVSMKEKNFPAHACIADQIFGWCKAQGVGIAFDEVKAKCKDMRMQLSMDC